MTSSILPGPRVLRVTLVLGALCGLAEALSSPLRDQSTYAELGHVAAHQDAFVVSTALGLAGTLLGLVNFLGLADHCRSAGPRLAGFAGWTLAVSMTCFVGVRMTGAVELQTVRDDLPRRQGADLIDHLVGVPVAAAIFVLFLGGAVIGLVCLGVLVWRAGLPKPAALMLIAFNVIDLTRGYTGEIVAHLVLLVASAWIAWAIGWRRPGAPTADHGANPVADPVAAP